ncbi:MAG: iron ABC transporter permease [Clostridiaceae bacterium]|nr:iron ABC transporter permease [Clostridiaceae bacterium]
MNIWQKFYTRMNLDKTNKSYKVALIIFLLVLLAICITLSICIGSTHIPLSKIIESIKNRDSTGNNYRIIRYVRLPRTFAAALAGCAFSVSGAIMQSVLNNALASPNVIGVNSGAGLFTVLLVAFFPSSLHLTPIAAFTGAMIAVFIVYFIAKQTKASRMAIVLSGVAVSSFIGAIIDTVLTLKPDVAISRTAFLIGGFSGVTMREISLASILILIALCLSFILSYDMNILALGDESAKSLGLNVTSIRFFCLVLAAVLAGSAISFSGLLGFVGLIIPHLSRSLVGYDNRILLPVTALFGAIFTLMSDLLARVLFAPYEIPVGIIMSFLGAPFFIYLLIKGKRGQLYD